MPPLARSQLDSSPAPEPSRRAGAIAAEGAAPLAAFLTVGPLLLNPRGFPPRLAAALDALPPASLPRFRFSGTTAALRGALAASLAQQGPWPDWVSRWFVDDVVHQAEMVATFTGSSALSVRLEAIADDHLHEFHVDDVRFRLMTTYRGPGTEWVPPRSVALLPSGQTPPEDYIRRLSRGAVAILRGARGTAPGQTGILHRSPRIAGTGAVRLLLSIEDVGRTLH